MVLKEKRLLSRDEACQQLGGLSMPMIYKLAKRGDIKLVKLGRRTFITADSIETYIDRLEAQA